MSSSFAVIGHPIAHTMSPFIHKRLFQLSKIEADYSILDIAPQELAEKLTELKALDGFNITIPHKQAIIPFLDTLDQKAAFFKSVNTVKNAGRSFCGYTTDGIGFCKALEAAGAGLFGRTVILGAGGAARVMAFEAVRKGSRVTIAARAHSQEAAQLLCDDLRSKVNGAEADFCLPEAIEGPINLLANATPVGMYPNTEGCPVEEHVIRRADCVFDAVYNPDDTTLLKLARKNGIKAIGGMSMLVWQAAAAQEIWYGAKFQAADIDQLCRDAVTEMKKKFGNLILCGFMGCGKTSVGKQLAKATGRIFVDMDHYIEESQGVTVSEIFARHGETEFRRLEREAVKALSHKSGLIIATGGGALIDPENAALLKENGIIFLLDADISAIKKRLNGDKTRPLLAKENRDEVMERLYQKRIGAYRAAADFAIPANSGIKSVTDKILASLR